MVHLKHEIPQYWGVCVFMCICIYIKFPLQVALNHFTSTSSRKSRLVIVWFLLCGHCSLVHFSHHYLSMAN